MWKCHCDCGEIINLSGKSLRSGKVKSCGCIFSDDYIGKKFGQLTIIEKATPLKHPNGKQSTRWQCKCTCGNIIIVQTQSLKSGNTKSCGCLRKDLPRNLFLKHGKTNSKIYNIYLSIIARCYYAQNRSYQNYGGRGITVCDDWLGDNGFLNFCTWSYNHGFDENKPKTEQSIDRINVNGNYEPSNCRWATYLQQANNKRNNLYITYNEKTQSLANWCRELNIPYSRTQLRISRGWSIKTAFEKP